MLFIIPMVMTWRKDYSPKIGLIESVKKKSVTYVDIIARKTVDEKIVKALRKKINIASAIMGEELKDWI